MASSHRGLGGDRPGVGQCGAADASPRSLMFRVAVDGKEHVLYEPIVVEYTLSNPTTQTIDSQATLPFEFGAVRLEIEHDGRRVPFFSGPIIDGGVGEIVIGPRHGATESVVVFFNDKTQALSFPEQGRYAIHASTGLGKQEPMVVVAPPADIEIITPR